MSDGPIQSRDFGKTWGPTVSLGVPEWFSETNTVEASAGTLFSILRQGGGHGAPRRVFGTGVSEDSGETWGPWRWSGVQGKMPDLLVLPSGRILFAVGAEGLTDGGEVVSAKNRTRHSLCTLFVSDDHGQTWKRDMPFAQVEPGSSIVPADSPVMCTLDAGRLLVVMQAMDRAREGDPLFGWNAGMSLVANIIEPVAD